MTVFVQRPGEVPEAYERFRFADMAEACRRMLVRSEPRWQVWVVDQENKEGSLALAA